MPRELRVYLDRSNSLYCDKVWKKRGFAVGEKARFLALYDAKRCYLNEKTLFFLVQNSRKILDRSKFFFQVLNVVRMSSQNS